MKNIKLTADSSPLTVGVKRGLFLLLLVIGQYSLALAQTNTITNLRQFFAQYTSPIFPELGKITVEDIQTDPQGKRLFIILSNNFAGGPVTPFVVENLYTEVKRRLPANFSDYHLTICAGETPIELLVPTYMMNKPDTSRVYRRELHQKENA